MSSEEPKTTIRGWFLLILGSALLLHTILPGQYITSLVLISGAIAMMLYGAKILGLYGTLDRILQGITKA